MESTTLTSGAIERYPYSSTSCSVKKFHISLKNDFNKGAFSGMLALLKNSFSGVKFLSWQKS